MSAAIRAERANLSSTQETQGTDAYRMRVTAWAGIAANSRAGR
jgi:hypothetical protein